jgi:CheY-like chemotaxis protein
MLDARPREANPTILLVEDDWDVRDAVTEVLIDAGYDVIVANDGREALQILWFSAPPAALVLDLFLPELNGWQLCGHLKRDLALSHIPVIVMTAAGEYWGYPVPPAMVLRKPIDAGRLIQLLETVTGPDWPTRH